MYTALVSLVKEGSGEGVEEEEDGERRAGATGETNDDGGF
jgi:hypothetical protein